MRLALALLGCAQTLAACGAAPPPAVANVPAPQRQATTIDDVMDGALAFVGGRERLARITSIHTVGTIDADGQVARFETFSIRPDRALQRVETPAGTAVEAVRGDLGWRLANAGTAQLMAPSERTELLRNTGELYAIDWRAAYARAVLVGTETFAGQPAFRVALIDHREQTRVHFFATDSLRELGQETTRPDGAVVREVFTDLRDLGGIRYPFRSTRLPPGHFIVQFDKVELDVPIAPGAFDPPNAVRLLVK